MNNLSLLNAEYSTEETFEREEKIINEAKEILFKRLRTNKVQLSSSKITRDYVMLELGRREREVFFCLFLDNQHRVIESQVLFEGTIDGSMVHPREVLKAALKLNAAAMIFSHNHPSGVAEPSQADISITRRLKSALELVDIRVLDHLIVGDNVVTSMAERGLL
ncbi:MAG: DNA repair protein RadC [SAR86 cluster bacterium]|uniref:DNA repair protein RadC n=1 Tax=SAR86 cluster bacterium TaxID=2030880 RepID=A0A2A5CIZ1_9GAMM|nr:MAG: DNA repair protein RadC [SAR86 cluster bacterium]